jgi:ADP-ribosylglycohydrolase
MITLRSRFLGTLVGVHVGDSTGAPYETWSPQKIADDIAHRGGLTFFDYPNPWANADGNGTFLPAGRPTDDSEQTACLAKSLLDCNGLDTTHLYGLLRASVFDQTSLLWNGKSTGAGGTTKNALSGDPEREQKARSNTIATNGSLMRASPMALWYATDLVSVAKSGTMIGVALYDPAKTEPMKLATVAMSDVTHAHQHSKTASWIYVMVLSSLLAGNDVWAALSDVEDIDPTIKYDWLSIRLGARLEDLLEHPHDPGAFPMRGTAEFSLYVALYALKHATSFAHGIEIAVRVGGDTDTYAAIAGGLLGAHYGYEAIPEGWRSAILGHDVMVGLANQIYERRGAVLVDDH